MQVLYISFKDLVHPCYDDFIYAIGGKHEIRMYDPTAPLPAQFKDVQVVIDQGGWATPRMIDAAVAAGVKLWQVIGTGLDHLDVEYILSQQISLANTPGIFSATALAEHAIFLMLCLVKNLSITHLNIRSGAFYHPMNAELEGTTLGLIGFGASARQLAKKARGLGMHVMAVDAVELSPSDMAREDLEFFGSVDEMDKIVQEADFVSLHTPLTSKTRYLMDRRRLGLMKPSAILINVARGELIEETALVEALQAGKIRGAGLDTFEIEPIDPHNELLNMENVIATPHIAGNTRETIRRRTQAAAENVLRIAQGLKPLYEVLSVE